MIYHGGCLPLTANFLDEKACFLQTKYSFLLLLLEDPKNSDPKTRIIKKHNKI
jgi:hypothetical protein